MLRFSRAAGTALLMVLALACAQPGSQEAPDGQFPRTPEGKPDFSGIWQAFTTASWNLEDHSATRGVPAGPSVVDGGRIPYQPWALAKRDENYANRDTLDPLGKCYLPGVPRVTYLPFPFEIVQTLESVGMFYEYGHTTRMVYMDGSEKPEALEFWIGDSHGHWEGETLVVDVSLFNEQTWFDKAGNFHSSALHVVERYTYLTPNHLSYEATIEDPNVFTEPWTIRLPLYRRLEENIELLEYECLEFIEPSPTLEQYRELAR